MNLDYLLFSIKPLQCQGRAPWLSQEPKPLTTETRGHGVLRFFSVFLGLRGSKGVHPVVDEDCFRDIHPLCAVRAGERLITKNLSSFLEKTIGRARRRSRAAGFCWAVLLPSTVYWLKKSIHQGVS
jgi:hypothetical protein